MLKTRYNLTRCATMINIFRIQIYTNARIVYSSNKTFNKNNWRYIKTLKM